jgi:hypothetical protein
MTSRHTPYHMLVEAFGESGCAICGLIEQSTRRYLDVLIHENVNDPDFRAQLRAAGGFCNTHAWWLVTKTHGAALGSSIMFRDILSTLNDQLKATTGKSRSLPFGGRQRWAKRLVSRQAESHHELASGCPACGLRRREESVFLGVFLDHCQEQDFLATYGASSGLCFPHFYNVLKHAGGAVDLSSVVEIHARIVDDLVAELDEFQRKSDYRFTAEAPGSEIDAWRRAIELATGKVDAR